MKSNLILFLLFYFNLNTLFAQNFERVENTIGLGVLEENNGVAVADYDGDLDLDLFVVAKRKDKNNEDKSHSRLFRNNNNGTFSDVTVESGLMNLFPEEFESEKFFGLEGFKIGAHWGDYDNDGFPDIFFTHIYRVQLFHNEGDGTFLEVTKDAGFDIQNYCKNTGATWFDFNNDGYLDIYVSDWGNCDSNSLYKNNGDGTFENVTNVIGLSHEGKTESFISLPFDFNEDGWMDLYVTNDLDKPNYMYINDKGNFFIEKAEEYGLDSKENDMGLTVGDFNRDGFFDIFITAINENILYSNNGNNKFVNVAENYNVDSTDWAWGARFSDFDLDGDEDLFIVNGFSLQGRNVEEDEHKQKNIYFKNLYEEYNNGLVSNDSGFIDISSQVNLNDLTISVEAVDFDYDNDGDLDIYVTNNDGPSYFYENNILNFNESSDLNWFKVLLEGTVSNRDGIGTKLSLITNNGSYIRYYSGLGFLSQSLKPIHFGLSETTDVLELVIEWPSGLVEKYQNLNSNNVIKAIEGHGYEILDVSPSIKIYGCTDPNSCSYNPEAVSNDGSCTYLPSNQISGPTNSGFFRNEIYSYPIFEGSSFNWKVIGGELIEGQGTNTIEVRWGFEENGKIVVREQGSLCSGLEVELDVTLGIAYMSDEKSVSRLWNEILLDAIRGDFARPTLHARNLFHTSVAMYDAWAIYDKYAKTYLVGNQVYNFNSDFEDFVPSENLDESVKKALSYAVYRLLSHRFKNSPNFESLQRKMNFLTSELGYDINYTSTDYKSGDAADMGNYIAETIINYGLSDGSNELNNYENIYYNPVNLPLDPSEPGNLLLSDPNRWQPLSFKNFVDQSGNFIGSIVTDFLSPEWGNVNPFSLQNNSLVSFLRDDNNYNVYHDPFHPPYLDTLQQTNSSNSYKWGFSMVSIWGSHLDQNDGVMWDVSPNSMGNIDINSFPLAYEDYPNFYNLIEGGDIGNGYDINPYTNKSYDIQIVPRGDFTRVIAEYWADGPDSELPPGHWFTILNYINDSPLIERKLGGKGELLDVLEWDIKSYFILGGAMHDAAISAWSIKGWYDYIRPVSAIRYMAQNGQSLNPSLENYNIAGIPLFDGYIELVKEGDPLSGRNNENLNKIKLYTWRGHYYINNPNVDQAGVGWILAENWWPYQRPSFVTPPFSGFVSGHSTYSRAGAEVLTLLTGNKFFPGGYGEFIAKKNDFLVFEEGPSVDIKLQFATYRDASDQCSLSRIWGGIHPPADDIPGRIIGERIGNEAYEFALPYFNTQPLNIIEKNNRIVIYPNPVLNQEIYVSNTNKFDQFKLYNLTGRKIEIIEKRYNSLDEVTFLKVLPSILSGIYILKINDKSEILIIKN